MREQEIANTALLIMTTWNMILGSLMIAEVIPVFYGMMLAVGGMFGIVVASWRTLMGDERPWESPKRYNERKNRELP